MSTEFATSIATDADIQNNDKTASNIGPKSNKQRFKPQLSCTLCRTRKLRCDRNQPCENCVKRDLASTCTYVHAGILRDKTTHVQKSSGGFSTSKDVHGRIQHLEKLVVSLMESTTAHSHDTSDYARSAYLNQNAGHGSEIGVMNQSLQLPLSSDTALDETSDSLGRFTVEDDQPSYVGGAHWAAILDSIAGLKDSLEYNDWTQNEADQHKTPKNNGPDLLVGSIKRASRSEVLTSIPPRPVVDLLVGYVIESGDISIAAVHIGTFLKEYEKFWIDPTTVPITWIGLLYAIMCLSTNLKLLTWNERTNPFDGLAQRDPKEATNTFREKTVQCLVLGNYTEPTTYTVETLIVYALTEQFTSPDSHVGFWTLTGLAIRAAMRLGYHRDPSHYPNVSVFQGEMQRRLWCTLVHLDIATSSSVGLPRMIQPSMCDTKAPRNLLDADFEEITMELPPPRPDSEITPVGYLVVKHHLMMVNGMIIDQANSTDPISYDDVMKLDRLLHAANDKIPEVLRVRSVEDLKIGPVDARVRKFSTDLIFEKARCVLHRKFMLPPKDSTISTYPYSTKSCVDSAMFILQTQALLYVETRPGQPLYEHKWKTTALMTQDFLLAAMLICLYVSHGISETSSGLPSLQSAFAIKWTRDEMIDSLDKSFKIWNSIKCSSKEALKAARALKTMLSKARKSSPTSEVDTLQAKPMLNNNVFGLPSSVCIAGGQQDSLERPIQYIDHSSWSNDPLRPVQAHCAPETMACDPVDDMMNGPIEFDWAVWNSHFNNNSYITESGSDLWASTDSDFAFPNPILDQNQNPE